VAVDPAAMILDKWRPGGIPFGLPDIRNYVATDQIAAALSKAYQMGRHVIGNPIEYCKSAPHPLSYLDGYALKKLLKVFRRNESVRTVLMYRKNKNQLLRACWDSRRDVQFDNQRLWSAIGDLEDRIQRIQYDALSD
jgi:hypothetical protein